VGRRGCVGAGERVVVVDEWWMVGFAVGRPAGPVGKMWVFELLFFWAGWKGADV